MLETITPFAFKLLTYTFKPGLISSRAIVGSRLLDNSTSSTFVLIEEIFSFNEFLSLFALDAD